MILLLSTLLSFVPALLCTAFVYWIDRYEKEPRLLVGAVFFWGAVVAVVGAVVSQLVLGSVVYLATGSEAAADLVGTTVLAPLTEESLKGFAVLLVFLFLRREFDSLLDGLVYAGTVALGFAATENVFYLASAGEENGVEGVLTLFVLRGILGAWDHAFYTSFIGIGLAAARYSRSTAVRWLAPPAGWAATRRFYQLCAELAHKKRQLALFGDEGGNARTIEDLRAEMRLLSPQALTDRT